MVSAKETTSVKIPFYPLSLLVCMAIESSPFGYMPYYQIVLFLKKYFPFFRLNTSLFFELDYVLNNCKLFVHQQVPFDESCFTTSATLHFFRHYRLHPHLIPSIRSIIHQYWDDEWFLLEDRQCTLLRNLIMFALMKLKKKPA